MRPHIKRYYHCGIWLWGIWLHGLNPDNLLPNYLCSSLSVVKDIQRGLRALLEVK